MSIKYAFIVLGLALILVGVALPAPPTSRKGKLVFGYGMPKRKFVVWNVEEITIGYSDCIVVSGSSSDGKRVDRMECN